MRPLDALQVVKELHHICYWLLRTYRPDASREGAGWKDERIPPAPDSSSVVPRKELEALEARLAKQNAEALKRQQERDALDSELQALRGQLAYLASLQERTFWEGVGLPQLEDLRLRLRGLVPFLDKQERKVVYTDFQDEVLGVREETPVVVPKMTGAQYAKKVEDYLRGHLDHLVIRRLRANQPLTALDLKGLETTLTEIGEGDGETLLCGLLTQSGAPSLAHFIRRLVGMDRAAAQAAFSQYLNDRSLTAPQIRFIEMVIDQLTARGVMDAAALYEPPFSNLHAGGPDALFVGRETVIDAVFQTLKSLEPWIQDVA